jgi:uncharacterized protein YcnI
MSVMNPIKEIVFNGKKPSYAKVMRAAGEEISKGHTDIALLWGENTIELYFDHRVKQWFGSGWIRDIDGSYIADELNDIRAEAQQFIKEHFIFVNVGGTK